MSHINTFVITTGNPKRVSSFLKEFKTSGISPTVVRVSPNSSKSFSENVTDAHINIMKYMCDNNISKAIIVEDDVGFKEPLKDVIRILSEISYDIAILGYSKVSRCVAENAIKISKPESGGLYVGLCNDSKFLIGSVAYSVSIDAARKIISSIGDTKIDNWDKISEICKIDIVHMRPVPFFEKSFTMNTLENCYG